MDLWSTDTDTDIVGLEKMNHLNVLTCVYVKHDTCPTPDTLSISSATECMVNPLAQTSWATQPSVYNVWLMSRDLLCFFWEMESFVDKFNKYAFSV